MKLSAARADNFIKSPPTDTLGALFYGPDQGLSAERAAALARKFIDNPDDPFSVTVFSADDLIGDPAKLSDEMSAMSLLGDARLIRLRLSHERGAAAIAKTIKALDTRPEICAAKLIIEAGDMTPRSAIRKAFEGAKHFSAIASYADNQASLSRLIKDSLREHGLRIEPAALEMFAPLLEGDRRLARGEIDKLCLYMGTPDDGGDALVVRRQDIRAIAAGAGAASIDDIIMDILSGNAAAADAGYKRAMDGKTTPHSVLFSLQRHLLRLHQAASHMASGQSIDDAMRALRPPVFVMQKTAFAAQLRLWPEPAIGRALAQILTTEKLMKTAGAPAQSLMGRLLTALSSYAAKRKR